MSRKLKKLIKQVAEDNKISEIKAEAIVMSQFKKIKETITEDEFKSVQLIHLGKFQISDNRVNKYLNRKENE